MKPNQSPPADRLTIWLFGGLLLLTVAIAGTLAFYRREIPPDMWKLAFFCAGLLFSPPGSRTLALQQQQQQQPADTGESNGAAPSPNQPAQKVNP